MESEYSINLKCASIACGFCRITTF